MSPRAWWALTPPSHPCRQALRLLRRLFSSARSDPREPLPVRKRDALCCPDFPLLCLVSGRTQAEQRQAGSLIFLFSYSFDLFIVFMFNPLFSSRCLFFFFPDVPIVVLFRKHVLRNIMLCGAKVRKKYDTPILDICFFFQACEA